MNTIYFIYLYNALLGSIRPSGLDLEFVANQPKPKSPSGAAGATAVPEIDEIQLIRQLLESLSESYRDSNITEHEKKIAVSDVIHILSESLIKEKINLKARLLRSAFGYNSFYLKRYLSFESNHFVNITLDEFREMVSKSTD
ncbi:hypothetical protein NIES2100_43340 [Calothrix sp. NIES-2100]|uniref:hypothetical protein n=1 Tax=Calothrix sp. NIES-2100 TaxID=1954172 RepID=UPI000B61939C|nr:hypothetical protein NIES2100_43340 [Calothrix sp. NIES-2100]